MRRCGSDGWITPTGHEIAKLLAERGLADSEAQQSGSEHNRIAQKPYGIAHGNVLGDFSAAGDELRGKPCGVCVDALTGHQFVPTTDDDGFHGWSVRGNRLLDKLLPVDILRNDMSVTRRKKG